MIKLISFIKDKLLGKHLEFRVRLFNVLAMTGTLISFSMCILGIVNHAGSINILINGVSTVLSFSLLYYSYFSGRYQFCYMVTIIGIFLVLFPVLFFSVGGYHSGMPSFFIFAVLFTVFMLEGRKAFIMSVLELVTYVVICLIAKNYPETVNWFDTDMKILVDIIIAFVLVSVSLGICMAIHFRMYNQQQRDLREASEAKSRFLANMSHEIRTPINVILGMNEIILRESESDRIKGYSLNVRNAGRMLMTLINNILDLATIEKGRLEIREEDYAATGLIEALSVIGEEYAKNHDLHFTINVDENIPRMLGGDDTHIRQIISNFLGNAAKYTEHGSIKLSFSANQMEELGEVILCIAVADTGIGITQESMPYLFDAFLRFDTQSNRYIEGSGLGLAIAKEYADKMGGHIEVESEPGKGSTFILKVPQKIIDGTPLGIWEQDNQPECEARENEGFVSPNCHLLIVDDNRDNIYVIKALLSRTLMGIDTAINGAECIEAVKKRRYDAILMDYMMPGMDGMETLNRLKELPDFDTPVIVLTANVVAGVRSSLLEAGFCHYLSKPVMWKDLEAALLDVLPKDCVAARTERACIQLPAVKKDNLSLELALCGIVLDDGLRYVSGDIIQYRKSASFFSNAYEIATSAIRGLAEENDWLGMKFLVHSLKGNARNLGANVLSETAAKLEKLCTSGDGPYIVATLPMLYLEWERAKAGLDVFAASLDAMLPGCEMESFPIINLGELLKMLEVNKYQDAMDALDSLIEEGGSLEKIESLHEIRQHTDAMNFREAERLLSILIESEGAEYGSYGS
jgi:signal transduction histidine kinase/ActR/RegA family two-component response regulator/HPt (histidine-containing phosphotransfer) domain-containing protein